MSKKTFILSDSTVNSFGFIIDMNKLNLDRFKTNPVMLYNHNELIGKWTNIRIEDGKLKAEPDFMDEAEEVTALKVKNRVEKDFVKGASIGFNILKVNKEDGKPPVVEAEVYECSIVDVPSNKNAITLYDKDGCKLNSEAFALAINSITKTPKKDKEMKLNAQTYVALGLTADATETQIDTAVAALQAENVKLKADAETANKAKIEALISTALSDGRFTADKKEKFTKLAETDYDLAAETINALPKRKNLSGEEQRQNSTGGDDRKDWTFADWRQKDTAGLLSLKETDPERYAEIVKQ